MASGQEPSDRAAPTHSAGEEEVDPLSLVKTELNDEATPSSSLLFSALSEPPPPQSPSQPPQPTSPPPTPPPIGEVPVSNDGGWPLILQVQWPLAADAQPTSIRTTMSGISREMIGEPTMVLYKKVRFWNSMSQWTFQQTYGTDSAASWFHPAPASSSTPPPPSTTQPFRYRMRQRGSVSRMPYGWQRRMQDLREHQQHQQLRYLLQRPPPPPTIPMGQLYHDPSPTPGTSRQGDENAILP